MITSKCLKTIIKNTFFLKKSFICTVQTYFAKTKLESLKDSVSAKEIIKIY